MYKEPDMQRHTNEDTTKIRLIWLPGIALGALCALIVWPQTHRLAAQQLRLTIPPHHAIAEAAPAGFVDSTLSDYASPIIRRQAAEHADDVDQQIAAATTLPPAAGERSAGPVMTGGRLDSSIKIARLQALIPRFADQPALYATILRLSTSVEVRVTREEAGRFLAKDEMPTYNGKLVHSSPAAVEKFDSECAAGERLDPGNGFFPMMHAISLFESHRDAEALAAIGRAGSCSHWMEYLDAELDGELALQTDAFGAPGPISRAIYAAEILLPHLHSIRLATELALYEAIEAEQASHLSDGLRIRTAVRHVGSLMRSESRNLIGVLVGMSLVRMSLMRPVGAAPTDTKADIFTQIPAREKLMHDFDAYLASAGGAGESASVHAEMVACVMTKTIVSASIGRSVFDGDVDSSLALSIADMIVLSTIVWMAALAGLVCLLAAIAGSKRIKGLSRARRFAIMTALTLAAGTVTIALLIQQVVGSAGTMVKLGQIWFTMSSSKPETFSFLRILSDGYIGIVAVIPVLTVLTLAVLCLVWRAPVAAGVARGLRGCVVPICSVLVIAYTVLAPITSAYESRLDSRLTEALTHEGRATARMVGAEWPGMVK
jgi:hypothetical protein